MKVYKLWINYAYIVMNWCTFEWQKIERNEWMNELYMEKKKQFKWPNWIQYNLNNNNTKKRTE